MAGGVGPALVLLNGAPGVGKSTVARALVDARPLALLLDLDVVRALLGDDGPDVTASYLAARELAVAMAATHLRAGHDVVVPQFLGRPEFVDRLAATAATVGVPFVEVALVTDAATGRARFDARGDVPQLAGARETWEQMHDRLGALLAQRPHTHVVGAGGDVAATTAAVDRVLRGAGPGT